MEIQKICIYFKYIYGKVSWLAVINSIYNDYGSAVFHCSSPFFAINTRLYYTMFNTYYFA